MIYNLHKYSFSFQGNDRGRVDHGVILSPTVEPGTGNKSFKLNLDFNKFE